jgi:hypothetical protein
MDVKVCVITTTFYKYNYNIPASKRPEKQQQHAQPITPTTTKSTPKSSTTATTTKPIQKLELPVADNQMPTSSAKMTLAEKQEASARAAAALDALDADSANEDEINIDTRELCHRIAYELKQYSIPQAIFADKILGR